MLHDEANKLYRSVACEGDREGDRKVGASANGSMQLPWNVWGGCFGRAGLGGGRPSGTQRDLIFEVPFIVQVESLREQLGRPEARAVC